MNTKTVDRTHLIKVELWKPTPTRVILNASQETKSMVFHKREYYNEIPVDDWYEDDNQNKIKCCYGYKGRCHTWGTEDQHSEPRWRCDKCTQEVQLDIERRAHEASQRLKLEERFAAFVKKVKVDHSQFIRKARGKDKLVITERAKASQDVMDHISRVALKYNLKVGSVSYGNMDNSYNYEVRFVSISPFELTFFSQARIT